MSACTLAAVSRILIGLALVLLVCSCRTATAQALPTASKSMDISVFGGFAYSRTDYGTPHATGGVAGVNITRYFHLPVAPSLEVRASDVSSSLLKERSVLFGFRLQSDIKQRFHPYIDFLYGGGSISFIVQPYPGYRGDRGRALSYGGGVDIDVVRDFQLKLDIQQQSWNLGANKAIVPSGDPFTLSPSIAIVGVTYRLPFRPHLKRQ